MNTIIMRIRCFAVTTVLVCFLTGCGKHSSTGSGSAESPGTAAQATNTHANTPEVQAPPTVTNSALPITNSTPVLEHKPLAVGTPNVLTKPEEYQLIEGRDYQFLASLSLTFMSGAADCSGDVQGTVDFIAVGTKQLELETNAIVHQDGKAWILTKDYGKIRVSGGYQGDHPPSGLCWWLTPSQMAALKKVISDQHQ